MRAHNIIENIKENQNYLQNIIENIKKNQNYLQKKLIPLAQKKELDFEIHIRLLTPKEIDISSELTQSLNLLCKSGKLNQNFIEDIKKNKISLSLIEAIKEKKLEQYFPKKLIQEIEEIDEKIKKFNEQNKKINFDITLKLIAILSGYFYFHEIKILPNEKRKNSLSFYNKLSFNSFRYSLEKVFGISFSNREELFNIFNEIIKNESSLSKSDQEKLVHFQLAGGALAWSERVQGPESSVLRDKATKLLDEKLDTEGLIGNFLRSEGFLSTKVFNDVVSSKLSEYFDEKKYDIASLKDDYKTLPKMIKSRFDALLNATSKSYLYGLIGKKGEYKERIEDLEDLFLKDEEFTEEYSDIKNINKLIEFLIRQYYVFSSINPISFNNSISKTFKEILNEIVQLFFERKYYTKEDYDILIEVFKNFPPKRNISKSFEKQFEFLVRNLNELNFEQKIKLLKILVKNEIKKNQLDSKIPGIINKILENHKEEVDEDHNKKLTKIIKKHNNLVDKKSTHVFGFLLGDGIKHNYIKFPDFSNQKANLKSKNHEKEIKKETDKKLIPNKNGILSDNKNKNHDKEKSKFKSIFKEFIHYNISNSYRAEKFISDLDNLIENNKKLIEFGEEDINVNFDKKIDNFIKKLKEISGDDNFKKAYFMEQELETMVNKKKRFLNEKDSLIDKWERIINAQAKSGSNKFTKQIYKESKSISRESKKFSRDAENVLASKNKLILSKVNSIIEKIKEDNIKLYHLKEFLVYYSKLPNNPFFSLFKQDDFLGEQNFNLLWDHYMKPDKGKIQSTLFASSENKIEKMLEGKNLTTLFHNIIIFIIDSHIEPYIKELAYHAKNMREVQYASGDIVKHLGLNHIASHFNLPISDELEIGRNYLFRLKDLLKNLQKSYNSLPLSDQTIPEQEIKEAVNSLEHMMWQTNKFMNKRLRSFSTSKSGSFFELEKAFAESGEAEERLLPDSIVNLP